MGSGKKGTARSVPLFRTTDDDDADLEVPSETDFTERKSNDQTTSSSKSCAPNVVRSFPYVPSSCRLSRSFPQPGKKEGLKFLELPKPPPPPREPMKTLTASEEDLDGTPRTSAVQIQCKQALRKLLSEAAAGK